MLIYREVVCSDDPAPYCLLADMSSLPVVGCETECSNFSIFCQVPGNLYWILPTCEIIFGWQLMCFQEFWNTICHEMDSQCQCYWRSFPPVLRWPPGNIFRVTVHLCGEFTGGIPAQRPVTRIFDVFFDLRLNKRLSKQSRGWWFETPTHQLWRHCNGLSMPDMRYGFAAVFNGLPWISHMTKYFEMTSLPGD